LAVRVSWGKKNCEFTVVFRLIPEKSEKYKREIPEKYNST
jgi:hypothetical protein